MELYLKQLDEFFAAQYADYVRIAAIEGYRMPEMLTVGADGNITRRDAKFMRLCHQEDPETVLANFKASLADTEYTFNFSFPHFRERLAGLFKKPLFARMLPGLLRKYDETPASLGEKLDIEPVVWKGIVRGKYRPEKNTLMAIALVCRMQAADFNRLLTVCGFSLSAESVRDVVFEYLLMQKIFNEEMRDRCLAEYKIETIPIKRGEAEADPFA